jgi:hypothetical protein
MPFSVALRSWRQAAYNRDPRPGPRLRPSVRELASACGVTEHEVRKWVAGTSAPDRFPTRTMAVPLLADALGVPILEVQAVLFEDHSARFPGVFTQLDQRDRVRDLRDPDRRTKALSEHLERWGLDSSQDGYSKPAVVLIDLLGTSSSDPEQCPARLFLALCRMVRAVQDPFLRRDLLLALTACAAGHLSSEGR